jgi:hypothetical protein
MNALPVEVLPKSWVNNKSVVRGAKTVRINMDIETESIKAEKMALLNQSIEELYRFLEELEQRFRKTIEVEPLETCSQLSEIEPPSS